MAHALPAGRQLPLDCEQIFATGSHTSVQHSPSDAHASPISLHVPPPVAPPPPPDPIDPPVPPACTLASGFDPDPAEPALPPGPAEFSPPHRAIIAPHKSRTAPLTIRLIIGEPPIWIVATIRFLTGRSRDQRSLVGNRQ
jgi:hypothetical protein